MHRLSFVITAALATFSAFGGQSIVSTSTSYPNSSALPSFSPTHSAPLRIEFSIHDWPSSPGGYAFISHAIGGYAQFIPSGFLFYTSYWDTSGHAAAIPLPATKFLYVRSQRDPVAMTQSTEAWDSQGNRVFGETISITDKADTGAGLLVGAASVSTAFFRVHSTLLPLNCRPPVTSDHADTLLEWKFDGDLSDASGNGHAASLSSPTYVPTPFQNVIAKAKAANAPSWSDWVSLRAGKPNQLDATASYSQADGGADVRYSWSQSAGPTTVVWDDRTLAMPTISGTVFGTYTFCLQVTDSSSNTASADLTVGAVATDDNGVVVSANPNVEKIFGPMIAFGKNPWGYMDERAISATRLRAAAYNNLGINPPVWETRQAGTVSYIFNGAEFRRIGGAPPCAARFQCDGQHSYAVRRGQVRFQSASCRPHADRGRSGLGPPRGDPNLRE